MAEQAEAALQIRACRPEDWPQLRSLHPTAERLRGVTRHGGALWVAERGAQILAYAAVAPMPGLPGMRDLFGYVAPEQRRQGIGSALLRYCQEQMRQADARQLSHTVDSPDDPAAHFLRSHGFFFEHEEWILERRLDDLPPVAPSPTCRVEQLPRPEAVAAFLRLYEDSFAGLPWYQPYTEGEVIGELEQGGELAFLHYAGSPVGFLLSRVERESDTVIGIIEPLAVSGDYQRRGLGRLLLRTGLRRLVERGAARARVGLWRANEAALSLYRSEGFRQVAERYYLACDL
ncbi:MAG: GNAT family N-acetyltransferase [Candidatus Promineifilaceae bacterium]|nr:GNAT family N-acetyltransferase [Candidatus Promineifilaceae bacterium]